MLPDGRNLTFSREKLKRSFRGVDRGCAKSFRILLLIESGPEAFPVGSDRRIDSTSSDVIIKELRVFLGASIVGGSEAFCSFKSVCCVKKSLSFSAFCFSSL